MQNFLCIEYLTRKRYNRIYNYLRGVVMEKMFCIKLEEQIFRNYNELYSLILHCYKDISILDGYKELQTKRAEIYNRIPNVSNHIVQLVQKDLALTIWKIYFDGDKNANTIPKFRNRINDELRKIGFEYKQVKKGKIVGDVESKLVSMRRQVLAHTDMTRSNSRIEISDLEDMLNVMCKEFNNICNVIEDERVIGISDIDIGLQDMNYQVELLALYSNE